MDKPYRKTSFDIVNIVRKSISKKIKSKIKIGHAGTLDPLATGLLILCTGKATKTIQSYQDQQKTYSGEILIGSTRPSYDLETEIDKTFDFSHITPEIIECARFSFLGKQEMTPPIHSAVKVDGKRAYKYARQGLEVTIKPKIIVIDEFQIDITQFPNLLFKIKCSKGTYIRAVAHEMGIRLQSGAHLASLRRLAIGEYQLADAWELEELLDCIASLPE